MDPFKIPYQETNKFSDLVVDYVNKSSELDSFISYFPSLHNFKKQIEDKATHQIDRETLASALENQNAIISLSDLSKENIRSLRHNNAFTVTTGHQLCLFMGPLYFIYKIISVINLTEQLNDKFPENRFVPVFWMATEDHDFEEINHINIFGKKIEWDSKQSGAVGRMSLSGIDNLLKQLESILGKSHNAKRLVHLFRDSYLRNKNLAAATRYLVNELFGKYGLVIIDGDDKKLKQQFIPIVKKDILESGFIDVIQESSDALASSYSKQAFVRDINFFKLSDKNRILITTKEDAAEIDVHPEYFSPNVLLRPLYQESILPNIATVGGGSEVSYWLQLKTAFQQESIPFPILVLRNSVMCISEKQKQKIRSFDFDLIDIFKDEHYLQNQYVITKDPSAISLSKEKTSIKILYSGILTKFNNSGLKDNIKAQLKRQLNALESLESKLISIEKRKYKDSVGQIRKLKQQLFPCNSLQERYDSFIPFYLIDGDDFIERLKQNLDPLDPNFVVLSL